MKYLKYVIPVFIFLITLLILFKIFEAFQDERQQKVFLKSHYNGRGALKTFDVLDSGRPEIFPYYGEFGWIPLFKVRAKLLKDNRKIYDVLYEFNEFSLRSFYRKHDGQSREHLILSPCSFIFGEGLPLEETLGALLEESRPELDTYAVAFPGGSLASILRFHDLVPFKNFVKEEKGKMVYVLMHDHLARWHLRPSYMAWINSNFPHYDWVDGELRYKGKIKDQESYQRFMKANELGFNHSALRMSAALHPDTSWSEDELLSFIKGLQALERRYLAEFPQGEFYLVFHPLYGGPKEIMDRVEGLARNKGLKVLNPHEVFFPLLAPYGNNDFAFKIPDDGHPNARANVFFADWLKSKLYLKKAD